MTTVEICVDAVDSALTAQHGGAHRIELCANLLEGGTTPSAGLLQVVRHKVAMLIQVMIRPRGGDFCYSDDEFAVMQQDVVNAKAHGADGLVFGLLNPDGTIDVERTRKLVDLSRPLPVTFHRAFDVCSDLASALEAVISTGAARILTSGGESSALAGAASLSKLIQQSAGRITILAGGGINPGNAGEVVKKSGVHEIHAGLRSVINGRMQPGNKKISPGVAGMNESQRFVVLREDVEKLVRFLN